MKHYFVFLLAIFPAPAAYGADKDWRDLFGMSGTNQEHLEVYSREGEPCRRCGGRIERTTMGGRGTWFCPSCQR